MLATLHVPVAETLAEQIQHWRRDIALCCGSTDHVAILCYGYNWATSPSALRTDREHRACRRFAQWCRNRLKNSAFWFESESGRYVPARRETPLSWRYVETSV